MFNNNAQIQKKKLKAQTKFNIKVDEVAKGTRQKYSYLTIPPKCNDKNNNKIYFLHVNKKTIFENFSKIQIE